eukprot:NODE_79_length_23048_cov_0.747614.p4 type:complete len:544 gc:universal NODE_79_length_23048_cov_0.747614:14008-15639(+)
MSIRQNNVIDLTGINTEDTARVKYVDLTCEQPDKRLLEPNDEENTLSIPWNVMDLTNLSSEEESDIFSSNIMDVHFDKEHPKYSKQANETKTIDKKQQPEFMTSITEYSSRRYNLHLQNDFHDVIFHDNSTSYYQNESEFGSLNSFASGPALDVFVQKFPIDETSHNIEDQDSSFAFRNVESQDIESKSKDLPAAISQEDSPTSSFQKEKYLKPTIIPNRSRMLIYEHDPAQRFHEYKYFDIVFYSFGNCYSLAESQIELENIIYLISYVEDKFMYKVSSKHNEAENFTRLYGNIAIFPFLKMEKTGLFRLLDKWSFESREYEFLLSPYTHRTPLKLADSYECLSAREFLNLYFENKDLEYECRNCECKLHGHASIEKTAKILGLHIIESCQLSELYRPTFVEKILFGCRLNYVMLESISESDESPDLINNPSVTRKRRNKRLNKYKFESFPIDFLLKKSDVDKLFCSNSHFMEILKIHKCKCLKGLGGYDGFRAFLLCGKKEDGMVECLEILKKLNEITFMDLKEEILDERGIYNAVNFHLK